jgi:hypothetical protein
MLNLILVMFPLAVSFACGYGVRDWMSRRRRKEARKRYNEKLPASKPDGHAPKIEPTTCAILTEPTIQGLHERLSRLEERVFHTTSETGRLAVEARSEFVANRTLLEQKLETET